MNPLKLFPKHLLLFLLPALLTGCMKSTQLTVLQPAQFKVPDHIAKIAVIDRSKPSNGWLNVLEGLFTGEAIGQDRESRQQAVRGLTDALERTPRFRVISTGIEMSGSKAGVNLPTPLPWQEVERICADYAADAVVAIESFDSDNFTSNRRQESKRKKDGKEIITVSYRAEQRTSVRMGWRLYDPKMKIIADEYTTNDYLTRDATGSTEQQALRNLPSQQTVTRDVARIGGISYGMRIAPVYVDVTRNYYAKAKGVKAQMKEAARYAKGGDWEKAAGIWKPIVDRAGDNRKAAGRAAYNMAVAAEMRGNLEVALEWAQTAWNKYGNSSAKGYIETLKMRQNDVRNVEYQLNKTV